MEQIKMIDLRKIMERLSSGLWHATHCDWDLNLSASLTEPTCPTTYIVPEGWHITRYRVDADSMEESLEQAVDLVHSEIIERKVLGSYCPFTNPDDDVFAKWLYARAAGSDERLPEVPARALPKHFEWVLDGWIKAHIETDWSKHSLRYWGAYVNAVIRRILGDERMDRAAADALITGKLAALGVLFKEEKSAPAAD